MNKLFIAFALSGALVSCKKETTTPNTSGNNLTDTTKTSNDVSISGFDCAGVKIAGTLTKDKAATNVTAKLTYTGGNGKMYLTKSHPSTGVTGLSATLLAGTLANGEGTLVYTISGTPTSSGTAAFSISLGGKTCSINISVEDIAQTIGKPGPNITDVEGNSYKTVYIGTQQWMAENLKVSKYNDGATIPNITDNLQWSNDISGAWCYYNNDGSNNAKYGKLYNWYSISPTTNGNKNICPTGWHIPTESEWSILTDYLGGAGVAGGKMKESSTSSWNYYPNITPTNSSLFSALPGGYRNYNGFFGSNEDFGKWWISKEYSESKSWCLALYYFNSEAHFTTSYNNDGLSVRCLRD
jgi:uncharacterized protein (TIGR02145 family)